MNAQLADDRRSARANVVLHGIIESAGVRNGVRIANLSGHGALVIGDAIPAEDTQVIFRCKDVAIPGWVAWVRAPHAGIQFDQVIQPEALFRNSSIPSHMIMKDTRQINFRRPGLKGTPLTAEERIHLEEWTRSR
jgi:hypothetical protein